MTRWSVGRREWARWVTAMLAVVAWNAAFPRAAYLARWPSRMGPRGLVAYVAWRTAFNFWLFQWVLPWAKARAEEVEALKEELRARLGREPSETELSEALGADPGDRGA